jgi:hypothetical protein
VTNRQQFLAGLAALPLHAAAGPHRATVTAESPVPCPEPTPGSVSNPRGSVGKTPLTDLVDAYSQVTGVDWQHQLYSTLSNKPGVCTRYRQNQAVANEKWLIVIQTAYRSDMQPAPFATGTYQLGVGTPARRHPADGGCQLPSVRAQLRRGRPAGGHRRHGRLHHSHRHPGSRGRLRPAVRQEPGPGQLLGPDVHALRPAPGGADVRQVGEEQAQPAPMDRQTPDRPGALGESARTVPGRRLSVKVSCSCTLSSDDDQRKLPSQ